MLRTVGDSEELGHVGYLLAHDGKLYVVPRLTFPI